MKSTRILGAILLMTILFGSVAAFGKTLVPSVTPASLKRLSGFGEGVASKTLVKTLRQEVALSGARPGATYEMVWVLSKLDEKKTSRTVVKGTSLSPKASPKGVLRLGALPSGVLKALPKKALAISARAPEGKSAARGRVGDYVLTVQLKPKGQVEQPHLVLDVTLHVGMRPVWCPVC